MGGGRNKNKRKSGKAKKLKPRQSEAQGEDEEEEDALAEEITALSAIFQEDFSLRSASSAKDFSIKLRAHTDLDGDFSAELYVKCLPGYPWKPPKLHIVMNKKYLEPEAHSLHNMLVEQAAFAAREGRVMIFNLAEAAQEYLAERVTNMQVQEKNTLSPFPAAAITAEVDVAPPIAPDDLTYHVLSDIWDEQDGPWEDPSSSAQLHLDKTMRTTVLPESPQSSLLSETPKKNLVDDVALDGLAGVKAVVEPEVPPAVEDAAVAKDATAEFHTTSAADFLQRVRSGLFKMGRAVKSSVLERGSRPENDDASISQDYLIQKDMVLAHLLRLACGKRGPLPEALPTLAAQLTSLGIIPVWVEDLVARQPHLFEAAFRRVFPLDKVSHDFKDNTSYFWRPSSELLGDGIANSRYLSDFEELCLLGRGGFGHVVLCKNKLDGRRYAMKKIRLKDGNLSVNEKIKREVATLSRLQHQHVVRYYQAWFETAAATGPSEEIGSSEDWFETSSFSTASSLADKDAFSATTLYIQMEYCPRTLKEVFESGPLDKESAWAVFRQIVEGLVHIHGQGIIHRDLTPSNIFFDARNDIKIGDFGLAKFNDLEIPDMEGNVVEPRPSSIEGTGQIGTYFYRAPEVEQAWFHIDNKVDMYSLGVILFELWHPFSTGMERIAILTRLKQEGVLPDEWIAKFPQQASLVHLLLLPRPQDRPSAREVLRSDLVPPRMEDEALKGILRTIQAGENSTVFDQVIGAIFDEERITSEMDVNHQLATLDLFHGTASWLKRQEHLIDIFRDVCTRHGASRFESSRMTTASSGRKCHGVKILTASGSMLELRCETRTQFAQWIAMSQRTSMRRYEVSHVYRKSIGSSTPKEYLQGDFDIVGGCRVLAEAEAIKVAVDILEKLPYGGTYEIRLNHYDIANAIMDWSGVPRKQMKGVAQILATSTFRRSQWRWIRPQLLHQLPAAVVDKLQTAERRFTGNAEEVLARLRGALPHCLSAIEELTRLLSYLRVWELQRIMTVDVFMPRAESYFDGLYFQIHLPKGSHPGMLVAAGGRYDSLFDGKLPASPGGVGLTVALQKLACVASEGKAEAATEVLICSRGGGGLLKERMEVANLLWKANIKAGYVCAVAPSLTEQYEYAQDNGIKWLVIITEAGLFQSGSVKVRHLDFKTEEDVSTEELAKYFAEVGSSSNPKRRNPVFKHQ